MISIFQKTYIIWACLADAIAEDLISAFSLSSKKLKKSDRDIIVEKINKELENRRVLYRIVADGKWRRMIDHVFHKYCDSLNSSEEVLNSANIKTENDNETMMHASLHNFAPYEEANRSEVDASLSTDAQSRSVQSEILDHDDTANN